jgi:hypothetical protein
MNDLEIGRVLRANTAGFAVGSRVSQLSLPAFGSLVKAQPLDEREAIYGLIYDIHIDDDPLVRRLVLAEDTTPALIRDQRENRLLPIEMSILAVGYRSGNEMRYGLPPRPPLNLDPVLLCQNGGEIADFTDSLAYLRLILRAAGSNVPVDQLLVAHIVSVQQIRDHGIRWVMGVVDELIELLRSNYELLIPTLEALSESLPQLPLEMSR